MQCLPNVLERPDVADGAEQTEDDIVASRELERGHVSLIYRAARELAPCDAHERGIEVETIGVEAVLLREQSGVFARATSDVEHRPRPRMQAADGGDEFRGFARV